MTSPQWNEVIPWQISNLRTSVRKCVRCSAGRRHGGPVSAELTAHLEDHAAALEARGLSSEEAAAQAVTAMGEPEELGRQLDRAHPPLLCLSVAATNIILVFLLVVCILALALWSLDSAKTVLARRAAPEDTRAHYQERYEYPLAIDEWAEVDGLTATIKGAATAAPVVWLAGDTKPHAKAIEADGGKWSGKKNAYYFRVA